MEIERYIRSQLYELMLNCGSTLKALSDLYLVIVALSCNYNENIQSLI
jgi:hypothetical protein